MIFHRPVFQNIQHIYRGNFRRKIKLHKHLNTVSMQFSDHIFILCHCIPAMRITGFRTLIQPPAKSPVIYFPRLLFSTRKIRILCPVPCCLLIGSSRLFHRQGSGYVCLYLYLIEFIRRHENKRCNTQFFQIRNLLCQSGISPPVFYAGRFMLRKAAHMKRI